MKKSSGKEVAAEAKEASKTVAMKFSKNMFYTDLDNPIFFSGVVYELEGEEWIQRWLKRGGEIVDEKPAKGVELSTTPPPSPAIDTPTKVAPAAPATEQVADKDEKSEDAAKTASKLPEKKN